jgi:hypothetical protein
MAPRPKHVAAFPAGTTSCGTAKHRDKHRDLIGEVQSAFRGLPAQAGRNGDCNTHVAEANASSVIRMA